MKLKERPNAQKEQGGDLPSGWIKQPEWRGNPSLGLDAYMKKFKNPYNNRMVQVYVFGRDGDWGCFSVSAGANSDFSYGGFVPGCETFLDVLDGVEEMAVDGRLFG